MHAFRAGSRLQLLSMRAYPDSLIPFVTAPLFAVIFLLIVRDAGREDLTPYAVVAPVFIALWWLALFNAGWTISHDRWNGTLETLVAAPASFALAILGRIAAIAVVGLVSFVEVWLVARLLFGEQIVVHHPWAFAVTVVVTLAAMTGTAVLMAGLFVLTRNAVTFSNSASYPFYVLGGILVPVSFLPDWLQPLSAIVFLSWSSDLLRSTLEAGPIEDLAVRLGMVAFLGACGFAAGALAIERVLHRVRRTGDLAHT